FNASTVSVNSNQQIERMSLVAESDSAQAKQTYYLGQNYPNPFSQNTKINYSIPSRSQVEIVLFDMQGSLVKILVNELKESGNYVYELSTIHLAKGIYYYRMRSGNYAATKKLMVQ
ncbi:MAG: T9SS type A sorting domain-containing protein, partial [Chitinophagales bacterium]